MNLYDIGKIPLKEKKLLVSEACLMFQKLKKTSQLNKNMLISDKLKQKNILNIKSLSIFETILSLLSEDEVRIIQNDFIKKKKSDWYQDHWSKTTYYKIKNRSIDRFIFLLFA